MTEEQVNDLIAYLEGEIRKSEELLGDPLVGKHHKGMASAYSMAIAKIKRMLEEE